MLFFKDKSYTAFGFLILINAVIGFLATYSMGKSSRYKEEMDQMLLNIKTLNANKLYIDSYLKINSAKVFDLYPELLHFLKYDICVDQSFSIMLGKISLVLSTSYNIILPFILYGPPLLPILIMISISIFLLFVNFVKDESLIQLLEFVSILGGFGMIFSKQIFPDFDMQLAYYCRRLRMILFNY